MNFKVSVVIPTLGRDTLYPLIDNLLEQKIDFNYEIVLIAQVKLQGEKLQDKKIKLFHEPPGLGAAYYRNVGVKKASSDIVVFIDDDELPMRLDWLQNIVDPIIKDGENIVTSGYRIKLGQGYLSDSISLLGFPGGGAAGFEIMWPLKEPNYTYHLCTGNAAFQKNVFKKVGYFNTKLKLRNEDTEFNNRVEKLGIKIRYLKKNEVNHIARKGYINIVKWFFYQGRSAYEINSVVKERKDLVFNRFYSSVRIIKKVATDHIFYLPGVLFLLIHQYLIQFSGYMYEKISKKKKK